jgi:hypothetical protein
MGRPIDFGRLDLHASGRTCSDKLAPGRSAAALSVSCSAVPHFFPISLGLNLAWEAVELVHGERDTWEVVEFVRGERGTRELAGGERYPRGRGGGREFAGGERGARECAELVDGKDRRVSAAVLAMRNEERWTASSSTMESKARKSSATVSKSNAHEPVRRQASEIPRGVQ